MDTKHIESKVGELRSELIEVMQQFSLRNPDLPAQAIMAGLGELLLQFSYSQVGPNMTDKFLDELKQALQRFQQ